MQTKTPNFVDWTAPIQTKCGKPARVIASDQFNSIMYPINILVGEGNNAGNFTVTFSGHQHDGSPDRGYTIINVPQEPAQPATNTKPQPQSTPRIDWTKPLRTVVEKLPARLLADNLKHPIYTHAVVVTHANGYECVETYGKDGYKYSPSDLLPLDLENAPEVLYFNVYKAKEGHAGTSRQIGESFCSRAEADKQADKYRTLSRVACIRLENIEGRFDD